MTTAQRVADLAAVLIQKQRHCAVAESCTGGLIAAAITNYPGSSQWFDCGFVTYSNASKHRLLDVQLELLDRYGAVSAEVVRAMAEGVLRHSQAQLSVAVSGIAGPEGGSPERPVGTIWFAWASQHYPTHVEHHHINGNRSDIRQACVDLALAGLIERAKL